MNISSIRIDLKAEEEGRWIPWLGGSQIKIRSAQSNVFREALAVARAKHAEILTKVGISREADKFNDEMTRRLVAEYLVVEWSGIDEDGRPLASTLQNRLRLCTDDRYRAFFVFVTAQSRLESNFYEPANPEPIEALAGEPAPSLGGASDTDRG